MTYKTAIIQWEYEDQLPEDLTDEDFKLMFAASEVDGIRIYPYIETENGEKYFLIV